MRSDPSLEPELQRKLAAFAAVPPRNQTIAMQRRQEFLAEAEQTARTVSANAKLRHNRWMDSIHTLFHRKERSTMFAPLVSILVIVSLLLGGAGASVYAAQGSLPDESLYAIKTMSEDLRLRLATSPQESINLALRFTNRRLEEVRRLAERGEPIPQTVVLRWQAQLDLAFRHAADMEDANMLQALERMRLQLQTQLQALQQLRERLGPRGEPGLLQAEEMLRNRLQWAESGQIGPGSMRQFRQRFQQETGIAPAGTPTEITPGGARTGPGPVVSVTPTPGGGYGPGAGYGPGPGPAPSSTCTPRAGQTATPQGSGGQMGSTSSPGSTSIPGSNPSRTPQAGDGGGPQPGSTCTPNAGPGPQPSPGGGQGGSGRP